MNGMYSITEAWLDVGDIVNLSLLCPLGFGKWHHSREQEWGGGVTVVYWNLIMPTEKPVWRQLDLECLYLVLGECDSHRTGLLLAY